MAGVRAWKWAARAATGAFHLSADAIRGGPGNDADKCSASGGALGHGDGWIASSGCKAVLGKARWSGCRGVSRRFTVAHTSVKAGIGNIHLPLSAYARSVLIPARRG